MPLSRRQFVGGLTIAAAASTTARSYSQILGANERVNVGLLGFGLIGRVHTRSFSKLSDVRLSAVSDAYGPRREAFREYAPDADRHADFRKLLDDRRIDAVIVATPDHWHALHTMMACAAGKDVYVEKPVHLFVREGEWMQQVAARHRRVVQVGTQQRSGPHYQRAKDLLRNGAIGEIVAVQCDFFRNINPGIGSPTDGAPPPEFDWEMHRGPAPARAFNPNRGLYHFRWFWDTAGGQMTNLGHHSLDIVHWVFDIQMPKTVYSHGGRWFLKDNGETPDTQHAIIEYEKFPAIIQIRESAIGGIKSNSLVFIGTKGTMMLTRSGFEILPDKKISPANTFAAQLGGGHPVGGPQPIDEPKDQLRCAAITDESGSATEQFVLHARNFIDCVKSRKTPAADLSSSHWVSTTCHLANISMKTGRRVVWNSAANDIADDKEASSQLERSYRAPWDGVLKGLLS